MANRQAIVGLGTTGYSLLRYLSAEGARNLVVVDTRDAPPMLNAAKHSHPQVEYVCGRASRYMTWLDIERVFVSPGMAMDSCLLVAAQRMGIPMDSDIGLFLRKAPVTVFAVTGTNGKSTVCSLAAHLMRVSGMKVGLGGNIGRPALDLLGEQVAAFVLELSSFQLERLAGESVHLGAILNVAPDHADRYSNFDQYREAKKRITEGAELSLENRQDEHTRTAGARDKLSFGTDAPTGGRDAGLIDKRWLALGATRVAPMASLPFAGQHGCANALAALVLASEAGADMSRASDALSNFKGLAHRCELVAVHEGVRWVNDSKATNVAAALAAVTSLSQSPGESGFVWILGGDAKGADLAPIAEAIGPRMRGVCLMGQDAERFCEVLAGRTELVHAQSMQEAVYLSARMAKPGDTVLLSPAAASYDMFEDFEDRGRAFVRAVSEHVA